MDHALNLDAVMEDEPELLRTAVHETMEGRFGHEHVEPEIKVEESDNGYSPTSSAVTRRPFPAGEDGSRSMTRVHSPSHAENSEPPAEDQLVEVFDETSGNWVARETSHAQHGHDHDGGENGNDGLVMMVMSGINRGDTSGSNDVGIYGTDDTCAASGDSKTEIHYTDPKSNASKELYSGTEDGTGLQDEEGAGAPTCGRGTVVSGKLGSSGSSCNSPRDGGDSGLFGGGDARLSALWNALGALKKKMRLGDQSQQMDGGYNMHYDNTDNLTTPMTCTTSTTRQSTTDDRERKLNKNSTLDFGMPETEWNGSSSVEDIYNLSSTVNVTKKMDFVYMVFIVYIKDEKAPSSSTTSEAESEELIRDGELPNAEPAQQAPQETFICIDIDTTEVCGYGTDDFPAFFTPRSGLPTSCRVDGPAEAAELLQQQLQIQLNSGMVLGVPVPEHLAAEGQLVEDATRQAVDESMQQGIKGNEVTPFLLKRINELTGGESLRTNIALIKHNAEVGAQLAIHFAKLGSSKL
ncbi:unnamed protein product [Cladocopium goreaui]|uniref:Pseudouridine-5'-phosphate glycosidase (PsiMP glycosidase) n=1 Tax=Cladocopium goreaui TaxID=2562237 RepID=A0A9P1GLN9_9DINO|nr:unnamed protein product [Cladocopium goreaui]